MNGKPHKIVALSVSTTFCGHKPQKVVETESATILWEYPIHTGRTIQANKPDITIKITKKKHAN